LWRVSDDGERAIKARPRRILVVDDNADAAQSLAGLLAIGGHTTRAVLSSEEALACAAEFAPDLALLDIGLPRLDGYELAKQFRRKPELNAIRLIALTGYGQAEDRERALAAGFDEHLVKPVDLSVLERTLAAISPEKDECTGNRQLPPPGSIR
jgi:CheY-like chemotaxis protein